MPNRNVVGDYRYSFQGQEKDAETGKVAFQLRLYDPRINRWLTTDPAGQYHSPYMAMGNNPISRVDPDGGEDDWYTDADGNYVYDSNLTADNASSFLGAGETYVGESFYDFNALQSGSIDGIMTNLIDGSQTQFLDPIEISNNNSILSNPTINGTLRTQDGFGSGHFGASRDGGSRSHKGIDITTVVGQDIFAPIDGVAVNFTGAKSKKPMLQIFPSDKSLGIDRIEILYIDKLHNIKPWQRYNIERGKTIIGTAADLSKLGYPKGITPHIHFQIYSGGKRVDPTGFFNF